MLNLVAYIDAGSGSYLLGAVAAGAAGTWFYIRSKFASIRGRKPTETTPEVESPTLDQ